MVSLPFVNQSELATFYQGVSTPYSPSYGQFLSSAGFTERFAPPLVDQEAIAGYLASYGIQVAYLSPDHLTIAVDGTLLELGTAFAVTFAMYSLAGQVFFAPTSSPSVPSGLAPWIHQVVGLTNYTYGMKPQVVLRSTGATNGSGAPPGSGVMDYPSAMTSEFQLNQLWNATGNRTAGTVPSYAQGVVIGTALWDLNNTPNGAAVQYCPYSITDIQQFFHMIPGASPSMPQVLPSPHDHANYNITGDPGNPPGTGDCASGGSGIAPNVATEELDFEMTIDQEWSGEAAPGSTIEPTYVGGAGVTVTDGALALLLAWIAAGNVPNLALLSQSFGGGESTFLESAFTELAAEGVTVLASSGDNNGAGGLLGQPICNTGAPGEYSWNTEGSTSVEYPGSSPNVLSVGGTANMALPSPTDPSAVLAGQTVWNWCPSTDGGVSAGSTGGVSSVFPEPTYQASDPIVSRAMRWAINVTSTGNFTNGTAPTGCEGCDDITPFSPTSARAIPDVGGPAANNTGYMAGTWLSGWGGTSFSSPTLAGVLGSIVAFDGHKLGLFNPTLYALEQEYLSGQFASLPFPVAPTYFVQNYSNAFFAGGPDYNTSSGWGVPQAYNLALLLGKPFISSNPNGSATVGSPYPVHATVRDDRSLRTVNISYLEPGASGWANASLSLASGTGLAGTWTGAIPAPTQSGTLRYCVSAVDEGQGNSWTPYNQSAWAATGGTDTVFGCTVPFEVHVNPAPALYPVTFAESGLPGGTTWSVSFGSVTLSSTSSTIVFTPPNGTYLYSIGTVAGYSASPSGGSVTVAGAPLTVGVGFTPTAPVYAVTFAETGLVPGTSWSVTTGGTTANSTSDQVAFLLPAGTYSFSVGAVPGYSATPSAGTVQVVATAVTVPIAFTTVPPPGCAASSISGNLNQSVYGNDALWFSSAMDLVGQVDTTKVLQVRSQGQSVAFSVGSSHYVLPVPDAVVTYTPFATGASTTFSASNDTWLTTIPWSLRSNGSQFLSGVAWQVPTVGLPQIAGHGVTWTGCFTTNDPGIHLQWHWGAAAYLTASSVPAGAFPTAYPANYPALGVLANDGGGLLAGTPTAFESSVTSGGTGTGGTNYTGSPGGTANVVPGKGT